ncbi:MAG: hypothetical protein R3C56_01175 [Pirellulaceae bacterium]
MPIDPIIATYLIETPNSVEQVAETIAGEQSSGTFLAVPGETEELKSRASAGAEYRTARRGRAAIVARSEDQGCPDRRATGLPARHGDYCFSV